MTAVPHGKMREGTAEAWLVPGKRTQRGVADFAKAGIMSSITKFRY
jgi:hypothetical protein